MLCSAIEVVAQSRVITERPQMLHLLEPTDLEEDRERHVVAEEPHHPCVSETLD